MTQDIVIPCLTNTKQQLTLGQSCRVADVRSLQPAFSRLEPATPVRPRGDPGRGRCSRR